MTRTETGGSGNIKLSLQLLWGTGERRSRGPKPGLSLDRIVAAAVEIADAEGLEAVSMRRLSTTLKAGTMSLYRYVPGKAELLDLMLDRVQAEALEGGQESGRTETGQESGETETGQEGRSAETDQEGGSAETDQEGGSVAAGWRDAVAIMARGYLEHYRRHPWLLRVNQARTVMGPSSLRSLEAALVPLKGMGLSDPELISVFIAVQSFAGGIARMEIDAVDAAKATGLSHEEFWAEQHPFLERAMESGQFPMMARLAEDTFSVDFDHFEFGLQRILDGLDVLVDRRRGEAGQSQRAQSQTGQGQAAQGQAGQSGGSGPVRP
ncbi:TetR/AcrR family transcriptional regulator [Streptomyces phyllanthi]|uniref:TetR/AcrR family transcriptional regulator n=1 Tax=Streptomyces phyllanthi TaxID=1803180 RepID=A0A5N8W9U5_9ACTN|nr:TetR/AcrR family transcriptional regulator C-terminal domain-containing protein [Streptomyces phyllanthi]MPY43208.1 TetR/AcrR family transcriptional regulator [Streptomyces phyllanthi]